jgi:hypothetical protein
MKKTIFLSLIALSIAFPVLAENGYYIKREPVYKDTKINFTWNEYFVICDKNGKNCSTVNGNFYSAYKPNVYKKCLTKTISGNSETYSIGDSCFKITKNEYYKYKQAESAKLKKTNNRNIPEDISKKIEEMRQTEDADATLFKKEASQTQLVEVQNLKLRESFLEPVNWNKEINPNKYSAIITLTLRNKQDSDIEGFQGVITIYNKSNIELGLINVLSKDKISKNTATDFSFEISAFESHPNINDIGTIYRTPANVLNFQFKPTKIFLQGGKEI